MSTLAPSVEARLLQAGMFVRLGISEGRIGEVSYNPVNSKVGIRLEGDTYTFMLAATESVYTTPRAANQHT